MSDRPVISVMVVDDTLANRWVLVRVLEEDGYRIIEGETAADAERLAAQRPDLMVLDVRLPDGSGFELARKFKSEEHTANIPLLLISASFTSPSERARRSSRILRRTKNGRRDASPVFFLVRVAPGPKPLPSFDARRTVAC